MLRVGCSCCVIDGWGREHGKEEEFNLGNCASLRCGRQSVWELEMSRLQHESWSRDRLLLSIRYLFLEHVYTVCHHFLHFYQYF